jgi:hypothetical protein
VPQSPLLLYLYCQCTYEMRFVNDIHIVAVPDDDTVTSETDEKMVATPPSSMVASAPWLTCSAPPEKTTPVFCGPPTLYISNSASHGGDMYAYQTRSHNGNCDPVSDTAGRFRIPRSSGCQGCVSLMTKT